MGTPARVDMRGRTVVVTGANSGIGRETAQTLAEWGATVVLGCRSAARGAEARDAIVASTGNERVVLELVDTGSPGSIAAFGARLRAAHDRVDVLVNNAGVSLPTRETTPEGWERMFAINHVGYWLMVAELLPLLEASPGGRIVNVASEGHRLGRYDPENLQCERRFVSVLQYSTTKLLNVLFTRGLARRLEGTRVVANSLHPGVVRTGFAQDEPGWFGTLVRWVGPLMVSAKTGAGTSIHLASSPTVEGVTGGYWRDLREARPASHATRRESEDGLWAQTVALTGRDIVPTGRGVA